jgi:hypothetical protein
MTATGINGVLCLVGDSIRRLFGEPPPGNSSSLGWSTGCCVTYWARDLVGDGGAGVALRGESERA